MEYYNLFTPVQIGKCRIKNRFAMAPMGPLGLSDSSGGFNQRGIDYYTERAKGGTGLIITGVGFVETEVEEHRMPGCPNPTYLPPQFLRSAREMTERIHAWDAKIFLQLSGGFGRVTALSSLGEAKPVAPSPIQYRWLDIECRELKVEEIKYIVRQFGIAAQIAKRAGFDGIEIHAVHEGYLIDQFAISLFNRRSDQYGGSLENRLRFAREIVEEIKNTCGADYPVALRYSPKSFIKDFRDGALPGEVFTEKGRDLPEGIETAKLLVSYGYDALDIDVGSYDSWWWNHPPMYQQKGLYLPYAKLIKETVNVPVLCAGRMDDPAAASKAIGESACDIIGLGRPLLADPEYVNKLRTGRQEDIRPCLSCHEGCMGRIHSYVALNCAVNPQAARERAAQLTPALQRKKVLIIGGGAAGCESARVLKMRGHEPVLFEKEDQLGGNLIPGGMPGFKEDDHALAKWYSNMLQKLKVEVHLNTPVRHNDVRPGEYDAIIVATGSSPRHISLGDDMNVFTAADVLMNRKNAGAHTAIIGGGLVGCELALWLREKGTEVALIEAMPEILAVNAPLCYANSEMLKRLVYYKGVSVITGTKAIAYDNGILKLNQGGSLACDSVILAIGYNENNSLMDELQGKAGEIYLLGDARRVSNIMYAIWDAFEVCSSI
jgi:2-enoate reductase